MMTYLPTILWSREISGFQKLLDFWNNRLLFMLAQSYCVVCGLWFYFVLTKEFTDWKGLKIGRHIALEP